MGAGGAAPMQPVAAGRRAQGRRRGHEREAAVPEGAAGNRPTNMVNRCYRLI
jgi:hypothetical protein